MKNNPQSQIVIYQTEDGQAKVSVRFEGETALALKTYCGIV